MTKRALMVIAGLLLVVGCSQDVGEITQSPKRTSPPPTVAGSPQPPPAKPTTLAKKPVPPPEPPSSSRSIGVGPVSRIELAALDPTLAEHGRTVFDSKCAVCHKEAERYVGPALAGVTQRRTPEWIMNMILNPDQMIKEDPDAKALFMEFLTPMTFQNVSEEDARAILEYFRSLDETNG